MSDDPAESWHFLTPTDADSPYAVIKRWERLRLLYNAVLVPYVIILAATVQRVRGGDAIDFWLESAFGGVIANVCFCLGPVAEMYLVWVGVPVRIARPVLFIGGTALTALAALFVVVG